MAGLLKGSLRLLPVVALGWLPAQAQVTVQVGTGTGTSSNNPINTNYGYTYSQQIYTAADIIAAGGYSGTNITKIRFYLNTTAIPANSDSWTVYMGNSARTQFSSNTDFEPVANLAQVFTGTVTFPGSASNWVEITLNTPFVWNGTGNIIVAVDENTPSWGSSYSWSTTATGSTNRSIYFRDDNINPDPTAPPTTPAGSLGRATSAPNIQFVFSQAPCSGLTPAPGNTLASTATICAGAGSNLSLQNPYTSNSGMTFQWQANTGSGWNDIAGATSRTYAATNLTVTTQFRCNVTCDGTNTGASTPVTVTVNALPPVAVSPALAITCPSGTVALTATGADTYTWSPAAGLSGTTGTSVTATPTGPVTYTVTGTNTTTGCINTATTSLSMITAHDVVVSSTPSLTCTAGSPVVLNVTNNPAGGNMEYQWEDSLGAVVQAWGSSATYTFTPATEGLYRYTVRARISSCPTDMPAPKSISVRVGFSADVTVNDVYCGQTVGSIVVNNASGPRIGGYANDFNTPALYGATLAGVAAITNNRLVLTPNVGSQQGGFLLGNLGGVNPTDINIEFDLTVGGGQSSTNGADGLSWSFGSDVVAMPSGTGDGVTTNNAETGSGTGLKIGFDAYGSGFPGQAGIYLMYNCTTRDLQQNSPGVIQYVNNLTWKGGTKHVTIRINAAGQLTLIIGTATIFDNRQLPAAYVNTDKSSWKHAFSARTGGVAENHELDNLVINYGRPRYGIAAGNSGTLPATWQNSNTFAGLAQGAYDVYVTNQVDSTCNKFLGTYTIADGQTPAPGNTLSSATNICGNSTTPVTLSLQNSYATYTGITWQWQSFDGTNWNDIAGATAATYVFTGLPQTTQFRCKVTCDGSLTGTSTPVTISAVAPPVISVTPDGVTLCDGEVATLTASGADTYTWSPANGLNVTTGNTVEASPTVNQTYTITGTSTATGCIGTKTTFVTPFQLFRPEVTTQPDPVCAAGSPVTVYASSLPGYVAGFGALEFRWVDTAGAVLRDWSTDSSYTFTPATEGYYEFGVNVRSTECDTFPGVKTTGFFVGFGGTVSKTDIDCHAPRGTITVSDAFGPATLWYANDFSSSFIEAGTATLHQNASITGGRLVLTPSAGSLRGGFTILNPEAIPGMNVRYDISFKITADQVLDNFGTGGADGIAYSFGSDADYSNTLGNPCAGFGSKLRVMFDAANNGTQNGNASGIYLLYGYTGTNQPGPAQATTLGYVNNVSRWKTRADIPVKITITQTGKFSMWLNDTIIFNEVQLPADFQSSDKTNWKHLFSAQTGGDALRHAVDDVSIRLSYLQYGVAPGGSGTLPTAWQSARQFTGLTAGSYDVYVSNGNDPTCNKLLGTYQIIDNNPTVPFPADTVLCAGDTIVLDAGNPGAYYVWNNGSVGEDERYQTITTPGSYLVTVTDTNDCEAVGFISITGGLRPGVSLGADRSICAGSSVVLDAGSDGTSFLWSNNSTNQTLSVNAAGTYSVTVTNDDGCSNSDEIVISVQGVASVAGITVAANSNSVTFTAQSPQNVTTYAWNFGDGNSITTTSPTILYNYLRCDHYTVALTVDNNSTCGSDQATTTLNLECAGINESDLTGGLGIYPNPASDFIQLANPNGLALDGITVFDATGKQLYRSAGIQISMPDISTWSSGMYLIKIEARGKTFHQRFLIGR